MPYIQGGGEFWPGEISIVLYFDLYPEIMLKAARPGVIVKV